MRLRRAPRGLRFRGGRGRGISHRREKGVKFPPGPGQGAAAVDPGREASFPRAPDERLEVEIRAFDDRPCVPGVHPRLTKSVLEARVEAKVEKVVLPAQRAQPNPVTGMEGPRARKNLSSLEPEKIRGRRELPGELDENPGRAPPGAARPGR